MDIEKIIDKINTSKEVDDLSKERLVNLLKKEKIENRHKIVETLLPYLMKKDKELCFKVI